ncbi:quaternary amine ABC transporter ATP-binding protein [Sedimentitalea todarodis]|uniref:Quaternary amine transport ATP-binding protein n=1 Tax=Sedimentitalea todarodis TaxID=1631240 RepID=A0ABU3VH94_9RHOB|nr:glycine betaine/L-proline ABC transporter ATP-binding protein [Sedimentitalea todarodis]MDU9005558.1 glycine betaine/L-proline ABC transporter ATP-binding protein [Sedimentitalea todarodis]
MPSQETVISCSNVWKLFGPRPEKYLASMPAGRSFEEIQQDGYIAGVHDVTLDITRGEMLVIMGLSGSGKSTLVRCFSRLHEITGGTIKVDGQDIGALSDKDLIDLRRNKMGMVFQSFGLLPHRTVLENVAFPLEMRGQDRHDRRERALEVVKLVGLEGREEYFPRELSGGQQQRVGIARSLAIEPDIWFLDEPFSALDPLIRREMQDEFLRLQEMLGKTIVFITHDFDEALRLADRIAIMKDGAIEQCDTPDQIVLNPATPYVRKFTEDIEKSRVVHAGVLANPVNGHVPEGVPVPAGATILQLARQLVDDTRDELPVAGKNGELIGIMNRQEALDVLLGAK